MKREKFVEAAEAGTLRKRMKSAFYSFPRLAIRRKAAVRRMLTASLLSIAAAVFVILPLMFLFSASLMPKDELYYRYLPVLELGKSSVKPSLFPSYPSLSPFRELLLHSPGFFVMFWNSCLQVAAVLAGQLLVGMPAAWAFARFSFKGKKTLFLLYLVLLIMPFQVTMAPSYLVLDRLGLIDTHWAVILPGVFAVFPVFVMEKFFESIPRSLLEAAYIDGASELTVFLKIGVPMGKPGIMTALLLDFFEYWSALEQPLTFLKDKTLWPLALYLPNVTADNASLAFAAGFVAMLPPILLYLNGQTYLEEGIAASGMKE